MSLTNMINEIDSKLWFKLNGAMRSFLAHGGLLNLVQYYVVTEYPKSGGTWLSQMISTALDVPFPRNRLPLLKTCLLHGHFRSNWNIRQPVIMWRDGRDVMVSHYHHVINLSGKSDSYKGNARRLLGFSDPADVENNLPKFMDFMFTSSNNSHFTWSEFVDYWHGTKGAVETKYELLHADTLGELKRILQCLTPREYDLDNLNEIVENFSFQKQSGRAAGEENEGKFLRKGVVGDWRNNFSNESSEVFDYYAGQQLVKLGYEEDRNWWK